MQKPRERKQEVPKVKDFKIEQSGKLWKLWKCHWCQHSKQKEVHIFLSMVKGKSIGFYAKSLRLSFSSVQLLNCVRLFVTPWTAARQASLCITDSQSLLRVMSIESMMPSNLLILYCPLLLPPLIFLSIRVFSNELVLHMRWPKYWSFSFSISPSNEHSGLISLRMDWLDLLVITPKFMYNFNSFPLKLQAVFFAQTDKLLQTFIWKVKGLWISNTILKRKNKAGGFLLPDLKT